MRGWFGSSMHSERPKKRAREVAFLLSALGELAATGVALRLRGLRRTCDAMEAIHARPGRAPLTPERMARLLHLAARLGPYRPACLVRSLALQRLLRRRGFHSTLHIGVRKRERRLEAHAWVEHDGRRLLDAEGIASDYAPFEALPPAR